jgi:hypothetical protein
MYPTNTLHTWHIGDVSEVASRRLTEEKCYSRAKTWKGRTDTSFCISHFALSGKHRQ